MMPIYKWFLTANIGLHQIKRRQSTGGVSKRAWMRVTLHESEILFKRKFLLFFKGLNAPRLDALCARGRQGEVRQEQPPRERRGRGRGREELNSGANNFQSEVHASLFLLGQTAFDHLQKID